MDGKRREEGLGWASDGWTPSKAYTEIVKLKEAHKKGEGPTSLKEKREIEKKRKEEERAEKLRKEKEAITFKEFFDDTYYPNAKANKKEYTYKREDALFRLWIAPVVGNKPFKDISPFDLEKIKKSMNSKKQSPRSIQYALALIRQIFNYAKIMKIYHGDSPTKNVKAPKIDNKRHKFLSHDEADKLLKALKMKSEQLYEISLVSLHCGLRAKEIFSLKWGDVDLERRQILIKDTKNNSNRVAYMTNDLVEMFSNKERKKPNELVFPDRNKKEIMKISNVFPKTVKDLKLNEGIVDPRDKVVFHSLRHTYASWMVENGTDLYTVKQLLGHKTLAMTERYSHVRNETLQKAVKGFDDGLKRENQREESI